MMNIPPYVSDILNQPDALRKALESYPTQALDETSARLQSGDFSRIILTGMGASVTGVYPAWLILSQLNIPVSIIEAAELLHFVSAQVDERTLLWITSQSGYSAEIVNLLDSPHIARPAARLGITNDLSSPVGLRCRPVLPLAAGSEHTVSTRTYINTLAVTQLAALQLSGQDIGRHMDDFSAAADVIEVYLKDWQQHVAQLKEKIGYPKNLIIVGRGSSLAAVTTGGLILKEASKYTSEGMSAPQFRHGPMELADPDLTLLVYAGHETTAAMNHELAMQVKQRGGHVFWLASEDDQELDTLRLPAVGDLARPMVDILPLQMLSVALAELSGIEPGKFRNIGKVTQVE